MLLYVNQVSILKTFSRHLSHTFVLRHLVNKCWCCNPQQMSCAWCGDRQAYEIECWMSKRGGKIAFFSCPKVKMQVAERLLKGEDVKKLNYKWRKISPCCKQSSYRQTWFLPFVTRSIATGCFSLFKMDDSSQCKFGFVSVDHPSKSNLMEI